MSDVHSVNEEPAVYIGSLDGQQVLVTVWLDGSAEIATRRHERDTWSPPTPLSPA